MLLKLIYTVSLIHVFLDPAFSERYRDLIEAADTISAMKSSAENVSVCVCVCVCVVVCVIPVAVYCVYDTWCVCVCVWSTCSCVV